MLSVKSMLTSEMTQSDTTREWAASLRKALEEWRGGRFVKPSLLAKLSGVPEYATVPVLYLLDSAGMGRLGIVMVDEQRLPIAFFNTIEDIPKEVTDAMGRVHSVDLEHLELAFDRDVGA